MARFTVEDRGQVAADRKRRKKRRGRPPDSAFAGDGRIERPAPGGHDRRTGAAGNLRPDEYLYPEDQRERATSRVPPLARPFGETVGGHLWDIARQNVDREAARPRQPERPSARERAAARNRADMPGSVLRTPAAQRWQREHSHDDESWLSAIGGAAAAIGMIADEGFFGVRNAIRDPSWENILLGPVLAVPGLGRAAGIGGRIAREALGSAPKAHTILKAVVDPVTGEVVRPEVTRAAVRSRPGRLAERAYEAARPESSRELRAGKQVTRQAEHTASVTRSVPRALDRATRRLNGSEQEALRAIIEGTPVEDRIALHQAQAAASGGLERRFHEIHLKLLEDARDLVRVRSDGKLDAAYTASGDLAEAVRLVEKGGDYRNAVLAKLDLLDPAAQAAREAKPGQIYRGGRWVSKAEAELHATNVLKAGERRAAQVEREAADEARRLRREGVAKAGEEDRSERALMRLVGEEPDAVAANRAVNRRALQGSTARAKARDRVSVRVRQLERAQTRLEEALTSPRATAGQQARAISAVRSATEALKREREALRRLVREGGAFADEQAFWADIARAADTAQAGRIRAEQVRQLVTRASRQTLFKRAEDAIRQASEEARSLAEEYRSFAEALRAQGGKIVGGEGPDLSRGYLGYERAIPGSIRSAPIRYTTARLAGGATRAIGQMRKDKRLLNEMTGRLIETGRFATDTTRVAAEAVYSATRLDAVDRIRKTLLSFETPHANVVEHVTRGGDIRDFQPVKRVPSRNLSDQAKQLFETLEQEAALDPELLRTLDPDIADQIKKEMFPEAIKALLGDANIAWVPKEFYHGVFHQADPWAWYSKLGSRLGEAPLPRAVARLGSEALGTFNDLVRVAYLYTLPQFYVANFLGNVALNVMQQGIFLPRSYMKVMKQTPELEKYGREYVEAVDDVLGAGPSAALAGKGRNVTHRVVGPWGALAHIVTDRMPRRSAWWHEAARQGYHTAADVKRLQDGVMAGKDWAIKDWDEIAQRAKDAIGDYDRLSPIERDILSKVIFFYPFVKAMSRYSYRFPLEHPYQAALVGYLGYETYQNRPEGPWYTQGLIEIPENVPYVGGKVTDLQGLLPFGVLPGLAQTGYVAATGRPSGEEPYGLLNPLLSSAIQGLTGRDEFGQHIPGGLVERTARAAYEGIPWRQRVEAYGLSEQERNDRLYPRHGPLDIAMQTVFGRAGPAPYNEDVGRERQAAIEAEGKPKPPTFSAARKLVQWVRDHPQQFDQAYLPFAVAWRQNWERVQGGEEALAESEGLDGVSYLSDRQRYAVRLNVLIDARPDLFVNADMDAVKQSFRDIYNNGLSDDIEALHRWINAGLNYADVLGSSIETIIRNAQTYLKDRAKQATLAGG